MSGEIIIVDEQGNKLEPFQVEERAKRAELRARMVIPRARTFNILPEPDPAYELKEQPLWDSLPLRVTTWRSFETGIYAATLFRRRA